MSGAAVLWVLLSAAAHVAWNTLLKGSKNPQAFAWMLQIWAAPVALVAALTLGRPLDLPWQGVVCACVTGLLFAGYYTLLAGAYRLGDLSLTYPIARGLAPPAAALWAILFLGERPSVPGVLGIMAICAAIALSCRPDRSQPHRRVLPTPVVLAIGAGLCTSAYSVIDKLGVRLVDPVLYLAIGYGTGALAQGLWLLRRSSMRELWHEASAGVRLPMLCAALDLGGYLIILFVLKTQPVSYVVPLRAVSVVMGVCVGFLLLRERVSVGRVLGAAFAMAGIVAIAFA